MSSDAALDEKLTELLRVMVSRLPVNKTLPAAVVQKLLLAKYGDTYPEAYVASRSTFIGDTVMKLMIEKEKAATAVTANGDASEEDDDGSNASDEDDSDEGDSGEDEEEDAASDSDDEDFDSDDDDDDDDDDAEEPKKKSARVEEVDRTALKDQQEAATPSSAVSVAERCKAMAECLRKLSYHVRAPTAEESLEDYLREYLLVEFEKHGMDPDKYSKSDIKRYRIKREVELLQQDGASLSLDRRNRAGRGFSNLAVSKEAGGSGSQASPSPSAASARQTSMFLDDE
ncbi:conserved hypothetical protein [Leishmania infantum JPCM5]|uniref:Uncharacterized protein n=2 Tax=Leishmania infantum TaxID=5671 RepID=A4HS97_LEIIN|nr:conserved hypothetical protein [Leishmania infantum JPCM5]CAC9441981.1 hypothetical_protein_-_conserved [Leishmania infantum]CAM65125.1 conserved hypothetical protein [Leishmania infantum JPCM5]SUZ38897.1 hypothetical_protein_-_conserved [Leishmania infantum]|eukprot:XP_001462939.1 conserved hypothetical protein [Leishmania infantum JPCM5]